MKKLYILGDCHFATSKEWNYEAFKKFINWFKNFDFGTKGNCELLQLGDVVEKASNAGDTMELVTEFFDIICSKFETTYILGGNHCHKMINNKSQYATQYLTYLGNKSQIVNIFNEKIFNTKNGFNIIALPYKRIDGKVLDDYYSEELSQEFYNTEADLICGHVAIKEPKTFYGGIDINKFKTKRKAFGHIHVRSGAYKNEYCGSIMPFKIDEEKTELNRVIKCLTRNLDQSITEEVVEIPQFVKYETINFQDTPQYKKDSDNIVHIYTVTNCKNLAQAKYIYPDYYIRGVEKIINKATTSVDEKENFFMTPTEALNNFITETKTVIKRKTLVLLKSLLEK